MSLQSEQRETEGIVIPDLKGPLTLGHGDLNLRDRLPALPQSVDSTGLDFVQRQDDPNAEFGAPSEAPC